MVKPVHTLKRIDSDHLRDLRSRPQPARQALCRHRTLRTPRTLPTPRATRAQVRGLTHKGKEFFRLEPALGEKIQHLVVLNTTIWIVGESTVFTFDNDRLVTSITCPAPITCCEYVPMAGGAEPCLLLGCRDGALRVLLRGALHFEAPLRSPITALRFEREAPSSKAPGALQCEVAFGLLSGAWGRLALSPQGMQLLVKQPPPQPASPVVALHSMVGLTGPSTRDLAVAYAAGDVRLFRVGAGSVLPCGEQRVGEAVVNLDSGHVLDGNTPCLVAHTQGGRLLAYTAAAMPVGVAAAEAGNMVRVRVDRVCFDMVSGACPPAIGAAQA